jgi:hypothetical protein
MLPGAQRMLEGGAHVKELGGETLVSAQSKPEQAMVPQQQQEEENAEPAVVLSVTGAEQPEPGGEQTIVKRRVTVNTNRIQSFCTVVDW